MMKLDFYKRKNASNARLCNDFQDYYATRYLSTKLSSPISANFSSLHTLLFLLCLHIFWNKSKIKWERTGNTSQSIKYRVLFLYQSNFCQIQFSTPSYFRHGSAGTESGFSISSTLTSGELLSSSCSCSILTPLLSVDLRPPSSLMEPLCWGVLADYFVSL